MVLAKQSRKGKKAWRRNIDTAEADEAFAEQTQKQRVQGQAVEELEDSSLFFVDQAGAGTTEAQLPPKDTKTAPRRKQREVKPLRSQAILHAAHSAKPVKSVKQRQATKRTQPSVDITVQPRQQEQQQQPSRKRQRLLLRDVWTSEDQADRLQQHSRRPSAIPAVEVMDAGSSFNPEIKLHQAVLARAVAEETAKANRQLLQPTGVSRKVAAEDAVDLDGLQVDLGDDEVEKETDTEGLEGPAAAAEGKHKGKKTTTQRNKEHRMQQEEQELAQRRRLKQQRRDVGLLRQLQVQLQGESAEQAARLARRIARTAEKSLQFPPKLGRQKFQPLPTQVLLKGELHGSLRRLRSNPMLMRDRFNSLQKRGVIEPRVPVPAKKSRKIEYQTGDRADRAQAAQAEITQLRKQQ